MKGDKTSPGAGGPPGHQNLHTMFDGTLPHYEDYEKNILGCVLENGSLIEQVIRYLGYDDFYFPQHQVLFRSMVQMRNNQIPIGILEIYENLKKQGLLKDAGDWLYVSGLRELAISPANIEYQARKVKEAAEKRLLWENTEKLTQAILKGADEETIIKLRKTIGDITSISMFQLDALSLQSCDLENITRDDLIEGFLPKGSLMLLSGKYGAGKSVVSLAIAKRLVERGEPVIYVDADMPLRVVDERLAKSGLKSKLGADFFYVHRSKYNMKIGNEIWHQFLASMKGKRHHAIILDNLKDLMPPKLNINLDSDIMSVMDEVKTMRDFGHTVSLLHHWGRDGGVENPFKNNVSIGDAVDVGYTIQKDEEGTRFVLHCFKDRLPVKNSLAFEVSNDFELVEVITPDLEKMVNDIGLIHETMCKLKSEGLEIHQDDLIECLKGIISKNRLIHLLRKGEGKIWDVSRGNKKTLIYNPKPLKSQNADYIYKRIFSVLENDSYEEGKYESFDESLPEFL